MKGTGEIKEVTNNIAFDLIERELAEILIPKKAKKQPIRALVVKDRKINAKSYLNRQIVTSSEDKEIINK